MFRGNFSHMTTEPVPDSEPSALARIWADLVAAGWRDAVLRYATHALLLMLLVAAIWARGLNLGFVDWLAARLTLHPEGGPAVLATPNSAGSAAATPLPQSETVPG